LIILLHFEGKTCSPVLQSCNVQWLVALRILNGWSLGYLLLLHLLVRCKPYDLINNVTKHLSPAAWPLAILTVHSRSQIWSMSRHWLGLVPPEAKGFIQSVQKCEATSTCISTSTAQLLLPYSQGFHASFLWALSSTFN
jgi:hypothetical protein